MGLADLRLQPVLRKRRFDPRDQIAAIRFVIGMLELAPAALGEVPARRLLVVRPGRERTVIEKSIARDPERDVPAA